MRTNADASGLELRRGDSAIGTHGRVLAQREILRACKRAGRRLTVPIYGPGYDAEPSAAHRTLEDMEFTVAVRSDGCSSHRSDPGVLSHTWNRL